MTQLRRRRLNSTSTAHSITTFWTVMMLQQSLILWISKKTYFTPRYEQWDDTPNLMSAIMAMDPTTPVMRAEREWTSNPYSNYERSHNNQEWNPVATMAHGLWCQRIWIARNSIRKSHPYQGTDHQISIRFERPLPQNWFVQRKLLHRQPGAGYEVSLACNRRMAKA